MNTQDNDFSAPALVDDAMSSMAMMTDDKQMDRMIRFAEIMATGKATIPQELRNVGDCLAITMQAMNWKMNPFSVAQKTFFISGKIGYEAQLVAAAINNSGSVKDTFNYEWYGDWKKIIGRFVERESKTKKDSHGYASKYKVPAWEHKDEEGLGVIIWATLRGENEPRKLDLLLSQATTRNSTLWAEDPRQQLAYLAQKRWARLYAPGVILGVYTSDELEPASPEKDITPNRTARPSRQSGAQAGESARTQSEAAIDPNDRANLVADLEIVATESGIEAYANSWANLTPAQRKSVGTAEHERLKKIAESIPGEVVGSASESQGGTNE